MAQQAEIIYGFDEYQTSTDKTALYKEKMHPSMHIY
jgi:hypothetical protein